MDILSFVLGICCVVVAGMLAGTVYLLLSVREMKIQMNNYDGAHASDMSDVFRRVDEQASKLDSRFDKCMHKINALEVNYRGRAYDHDSVMVNPGKWVYNPGPECSTEDNE